MRAEPRPTITRTAGTTGTRNFWNVADSVTNGSVIYNETTASDANILAALRLSDGWKFTITLRVNSSIDPTFTGPGDTTYGAATFIDIRTGVAPQDAQGHLLNTIAFVNDANRGINGIYNASNGGTAFDPADSAKLISNVDVGQFHTLSMVMVPDNSNHANDAVFIYLDGQTSSIFTLAGSNIGQSTVARVQVGAAAQGQTQNVDYENFTFQSPAPEPAAMGILFCAAGMMLARRPRMLRVICLKGSRSHEANRPSSCPPSQCCSGSSLRPLPRMYATSDRAGDSFVDHYLIDRLTNTELKLTSGRSRTCARVRQALGRDLCGYVTILHSDEKFQAYYRGSNGKSTANTGTGKLCVTPNDPTVSLDEA